MEQLVVGYLQGYLQQGLVVPLLLAFVAGIATSIGPCNLAMVPVLMAYIGAQAEQGKGKNLLRSLTFTLGAALTLAALGLSVALVGGIFSKYRTMLMLLVAAVCIVIGLKLLGLIKLELPTLGVTNLTAKKSQSLVDIFVLGLTMGLVGSQCATPFLVVVLTLVFGVGKVIFGAILLFVYGLGRGLLLVVAGVFAGEIKDWRFLATRSHLIEKGSGLVLVGFGLYYLAIA